MKVLPLAANLYSSRVELMENWPCAFLCQTMYLQQLLCVACPAVMVYIFVLCMDQWSALEMPHFHRNFLQTPFYYFLICYKCATSRIDGLSLTVVKLGCWRNSGQEYDHPSCRRNSHQQMTVVPHRPLNLSWLYL